MNIWKTYKVRELVDLGILERPMDGNHGEIHPKGSDFTKTGVPFIMATDIKNGKLDLFGCKFISKEQSKKLRKGFSYSKDVLLTHKASIGRTAIVPQLESEYIMLTPQVTYYRVKDETQLNYKYLKFYFDSNGFQEIINSFADSGSTRSYIGITEQLNLPIILPPIENQRYIAYILSSLDDKIELNLQMNKTLEAIAQAVFKEWFVDIRFPGFDGIMVDGLPKGWKKNEFRNHIIAERGLSYKGIGLSMEGKGIPMNNLNSVYEGGGYKYEGIKYYNGEYKERHITRPGDIIVTNTEQGHKYLLIGYPAVVPGYYGETTIYSHHIYRVRPKSESTLTSQFIYYLLLQPNIRNQIVGCCNGTTVNMLKIDGLQRPLFILPPVELIKKFSEVVQSIWQRKETNFIANQTLIQLRDTLLPRLMTGKIKVA